jgi:hypothetical protein
MIDYIVVAEFDINQGNVIKLEYPSKIGIQEIVLSSFLIPEGSHNIMNDTFYCVLKNKVNMEKETKIIDYVKLSLTKLLNVKELGNKNYRLKKVVIFDETSQKWKELFVNSKSITLRIKYSENSNYNQYYFSIVAVDSEGNYPEKETTITSIHKDIQFKKLENNFASLYDLNHTAYGFNFEEDKELVQLESVINKNIENYIDNVSPNVNEDLFSEIEISTTNNKDLHCLCYLDTIKDKNLVRGASMKSVAFCSSKIFNLTALKPVAKVLLAEIFKISFSKDNPEIKDKAIKDIVHETFTNLNSIPRKYFLGPSIKRTLLSNFNFKNHIYMSLSLDNQQFADYLAQKTQKITISNQQIVIDLHQFSSDQKSFNSNILEFISVFKEGVMTILEAVMTDKKIMFVGDNSISCEKLCNSMFNIISLVGNQPGVANKIFGIRNLYELDFLDEKGAIYCVTNPIFKMKKDAWDLMCEVDTGKLTLSESFKKELSTFNSDSNKQFIKELMYKIKADSLDCYQVENYFKYYINYLIDIFSDSIAVDDEDIVDDINKQWQRKLKYKQSKVFQALLERESMYEIILSNGISYKQILHQTKNLLYRKYIDKAELKLIYSNILRFLSKNEFAIGLFIGILLDYCGTFKFFLPVFSKVEEISKICKEIVSLMKSSKFKLFIDIVLNYSFEFGINNSN